jgi:uncharacterized protein YhdP
MSSPNAPPPPDTGAPAGGAHAGGIAPAVHAAEVLVERAVVAAERSLARRLGEGGLRIVLVGLRAAWILGVLSYFAFGASLLVTRYYLLPHIDEWRPRIEAEASAALHAPVTVGRIDSDWEGFNPRLSLADVVLKDPDGGTALALPQVTVVLSWTSLLAWAPRMDSMTVSAPEFEVKLLRDHRLAIAGIVIDPQSRQEDSGLLDWVLSQRHISVRDARVHLVDERGAAGASAVPAAVPDAVPAALPAAVPGANPHAGTDATPAAAASAPARPGAPGGAAPGAAPVAGPSAAPDATADAAPAQRLEITDVNFVLRHRLTGHSFSLQLRPPAQLSGAVDLRGEFARPWTAPSSRMSSWHGRLFVQFDTVDLARLDALTHLVPAPARIESAHGALRAWIDFEALEATRVRADVALDDVAAQLRPDLQSLRLDRVQGRFTRTQSVDGDLATDELALVGLQLDGPQGLHLPPTDLLFRTQRPRAASASAAGTEVSHFEANRLVLSDWSRLLTEVPLPADWLALIERTAAHGTLEDVRATWDPPAPAERKYSMHARFSGLGFSLAAAVPGPGGATAGAIGAAGPDPTATAPTAAPVAPTAAGAAGGGPDGPTVLDRLDGEVDLNQDSGALRIDTRDARLRLPAVFGDAPLAFDTLAGRIRWSRGSAGPVRGGGDAAHGTAISGRGVADDLEIDVDTFSAANADLDVSAAGTWQARGLDPPHLEASGRVNRARLRRVPAYLPRGMAAQAREWLQGGLLDGSVSNGTFFVRGDPARFPFGDAKAGDFHASLHVLDGRIDVAPRPAGADATEATRRPLWPQLTDIDANIAFERNLITVSARRIKAYDYELSNVTARLPQIDRPDQHLLLEGQGEGALAELLRVLVASPVNEITGGFLPTLAAEGASRLRLKLDIPLGHANDSIVNGTLSLRDDKLTIGKDIAPFSALNGDLDFNQRGVHFAGITAQFLGGDAHVSGDTKADGSVVIVGSGTATPPGVRPQVQPPFLRRAVDHMRGLIRYNAAVVVQHGTVGVQIDSDLVGLAIDVAEPFHKSTGEARPLHIGVEPVAGAHPARDVLRVSLGAVAGVELHRAAGDAGEMRIERGAIGIGASPNLPGSGLLLMVDEAHVDVDYWQKLLGLSSSSSSPSPASPAAAGGSVADGSSAGDHGADAADGDNPLNAIVMKASGLTIDGKSLRNVSLSARREADLSWSADIDSDQAVGSVHWVAANASTAGVVTARLARLAIPERDQPQVANLLDAPPAELPALDIIADDFELGARKLGRLEVVAQNSPGSRADSWNVQKLVVSNPDGKLSGSGAWQREGGAGARRMAMKVNLSCSNAGGMLGRFGFPGTFKNGTGKLEGDLSWRGSPFSIDYPSLDGKLHLAMEKGQFLKADAGAGRLLGVLSLQSLPQRLMGDFRDVFAEGFAFDSMSANATIARGNLSTEDLITKGVNAVVRIKGSVDLNAETQNLEVVVVPEFNLDSTILYAAINPAIGLAAFVGQFILRRPLAAANTKIYRMTGTWADPQFTSLKAESLGSTPGSPGEAPATDGSGKSASATAPGP